MYLPKLAAYPKFRLEKEIVVRSIYKSKIPIISAVGHETDTTLSDYAADFRASTPSVAAEVAAMNREEILQKISERDQIDKNRKYSPLLKAKDAIYIDNTNLSLEGQISKIIKIINN